MKNNFITKIIGATLAFAMMIGGAVGINAAKQAKEVNADDVEGTALTFDANSSIILKAFLKNSNISPLLSFIIFMTNSIKTSLYS